MWKTWAASPKDTSTASSSASEPSFSRVGAATKKSSTTGFTPAPATSM